MRLSSYLYRQAGDGSPSLEALSVPKAKTERCVTLPLFAVLGLPREGRRRKPWSECSRGCALQGLIPPSHNQARLPGPVPSLLSESATSTKDRSGDPVEQMGTLARRSPGPRHGVCGGSTGAWACWTPGAPSALHFRLTPRPQGGDRVKARPGLRLCSDSDGLQRTYLTILFVSPLVFTEFYLINQFLFWI